MENHRHLAGLPEPWEVAQGSTAERTATMGRSAIDYRELTDQNDASGDSKSWKKVQSLGQESMQLMLANEDPLKREYGAILAEVRDNHDSQLLGNEGSQEADEESTDANDSAADINAILDADYDTSTWSVHEIESACNTLLAECESTLVLRRRLLSTRMLLRLVDRHPEARKFVEVAFETIVNRGIPSMSYGISERTFCVAHLLAAVSPRLAEKLSTLNITPRIFKMATREAALAAQVLQNRVRVRARRKADELAAAQGQDPPLLEVVARQRLMANMKTDDLNQRFRHLRCDPLGGKVPAAVLLSYLKCVVEATSSDHPKYAGLNRQQVVKAGGLVVVVGCLRDQDPETRSVARQILLNVGQEPTLLRAVLVSQAVAGLLRALTQGQGQGQGQGGGDPLLKCSALEVLDALAANTVAVAGLAQHHHESSKNKNLTSVGLSTADMDATALLKLTGTAHDLNPSVFSALSSSPLSDEELLRASNRDAIRRFLITKQVVGTVLEQLFDENAEVFLGSVLVAHKMACSVFYHVVLEELVAGAGRVLERCLDALQSNHDVLAVAACSFVCHMATRSEGRHALVSCGIVGMLEPLVQRAREFQSREFVLALTVVAALAEYASLPPIPPNATSLDVRPGKLTDRLYQNLMASVSRAPPAAEHFVTQLLAMRMVPSVLRFLVRPEAPTHLFDLTKQQRFLGGLILHRVCCCHAAKGAEAFFHEATILYGCFLVQHNFGEMVDGSAFADLSEEDLPLFFLSTQAGLSLLGELAGASDPPNARALVALTVRRTNTIGEVASLLRYPEAKHDPLYRLKMECVVSAALLVASLAPRPEADTLPESDLELLKSELEDAATCAGLLHEIVVATAKPLFLIVQCCENRSAVSASCLALSRLASVNDSCATLLQPPYDAVTVLANLVPSRPTVKHNMTSAEKDHLMRGDAVQMVRLPPSFFRLLGSLARLPDGVKAVQAKGVLKRCVERMSMGDGHAHDLAVKTEIALLLGRAANKYSTEFGSTTELLLSTKFKLVHTLLGLLSPRRHPKRTRFAAAHALRSLCEDVSRGAPVIAETEEASEGKGGGGFDAIFELVQVVSEPSVAHPLLRECVEALRLMASTPTDPARMASRFHAFGATAALQRVAVNAELDDPYRDSSAGMNREGLGDVARDTLSLLTDNLGAKKGAEETQQQQQQQQRQPQLPQLPSSGAGEEPVVGILQRRVSAGVLTVESSGGGDKAPVFDGTYAAVGVGAYGGLLEGTVAEAGGGANETTPLALLSARDKGFRAELRRRKRYHQLDRTPMSAGEGEGVGKGAYYAGGGEGEFRQGSSTGGREGDGEKLTNRAPGETGGPHSPVPVVPLKARRDIEPPLCGTTVASLEQNPHLKRTRPPGMKKPNLHSFALPGGSGGGDGEMSPRIHRQNQQTTTRPVIPLAQQKRNQQVVALPPPGKQRDSSSSSSSAAANSTATLLMLDPVFGGHLVNESGDRSKLAANTAEAGSSMKQISAATLGSEQFQHSATILGHRVGVTYQRVVPGRVSHSSAHSETTSFKNVEGSVAALMADREVKAKGLERSRRPHNR